MGDSGALLLGFTLGAVSVQGLLKTAALATLVLPLLVLAVPLLDTSFVVARRIKHGQPVYLADRAHLHHRFENIGFSQRRAVVYLYGWCVTLALAALATRFVHPHRARPLGRVERRDRRGRRRARARRVGLRRLPARDRQAREPVHPPPRGAGARRAARRAPERAHGRGQPRDLRTKSARLRTTSGACAVTNSGRPPHAPLCCRRWSRSRRVRFRLPRPARCSSSSRFS